MSETPRRRRAAAPQTPERVGQAAQAMQSGPASPRNGWPQPQYSQKIPQHDPGMAQNGYNRQAYPNPAYPQQSPARDVRANPGYGAAPQYTSGTHGFQNNGMLRGFVPQAGPQVTPPAPASPPPEKPKKAGRKGFSVWGLVRILAILGVLAGLAVYGVSRYKTWQIDSAVTPYDNLFCEGVYVDGIHLGGMTPEQAWNSVTSQINQRNDNWRVTLSYQGNTLASIGAADLGMRVDITDVLNNAWYQGHTGNNEQRLAAMQALKTSPWVAYTAHPGGDTSVIDTLLENIKAGIDTPPTDAYLIEFNTDYSYPFLFQPESTGLSLDIAPIREQLYEMVSTMTGGDVEIVPTVLQPAQTMADLKKHYTLRATATTKIATSSTDDRNNNIRRAFEMINGKTVNPGKQFSFNAVVGARTPENGFYEAVEYVSGEHVMGVGGGVCQASTTVYQAAVCAGLKIVKRSAHSDSVGYADYGMDATVYYSKNRKIDLVFENNTDQPVYLTACVMPAPNSSKRLITRVCIYGEDMGDTHYEMKTEVLETLAPPDKPEYKKDTKAEYVTYTDQQKSVQKAQEGYVVASYRVEYSGDVAVNEVLLYTDTFDPKPERIYVGVTKRSN